MCSKYFYSLSATKKITICALFLALSVVANTILDIDITPQNKITVTYLVMFLTAYFLGPAPAFFIGFAGDGLGYLIIPDGTYWFYGLSLGLMGLVMGLLLHKLPIKNIQTKAIITYVICYIVFTVVLNSIINYGYAITFLWGGEVKKSLWLYLAGYLPPRLAIQTIVYVVNCILCSISLPIIHKINAEMAESGRWRQS